VATTDDELTELNIADTLMVADFSEISQTALSQPLLTDKTHDFHLDELLVPTGLIAASSLFISTPKLTQARNWVQQQFSNSTGQPSFEIENYLQYAPMVASYAFYFGGIKGEHNLLDRTILLAMSYAIYAALNNTMKWVVDERRPNSGALNSFPSGHSGTAFVGAEFLRREYWKTNKLVVVLGYACALTTDFLRIYNNRHWINDVVAGAALGSLSTTLAYWLYPVIFRHRHQLHVQELQRRQSPQVTWLAAPYFSTNSVGVTGVLAF
jgi:hypothetical protein